MSIPVCHIPAHLANLSFDAWTDDAPGYAIAKCKTCKTVVRITTVQQRKLSANRGEVCTLFNHTSPSPGVTYNRTYNLYSMPCPTEGCCFPWSSQHTILTFRPIVGTYSAQRVCSAKCMGASGPNCECACAGANHGGNHHR